MIRLPKRITEVRNPSPPRAVIKRSQPTAETLHQPHNTDPKDFYIVITSIRTYETALTRLLESFPAEFKKKYIVIFQKEEETDFKVFEDGHIEVSLTSNIYEYAAWTGVSLLQRTGTVPEYSWFLFVHDTSEFFQDSWLYINNIINTYHDTPTDVVWLSPTGQCNICLVRRNAIKYGSEIYKDEYTMTKRDAIEYEWGHVANPKHNKPLCPKCFDINQQFVQQDATLLGRKNVYGNITREVLYFPSIHFQKYLVPGVIDTGDHPHRP